MSSLTIEKLQKKFPVYQLDIHRGQVRVRGRGPATGRTFSIRTDRDGKWLTSLLNSGESKVPRHRLGNAESPEEAIQLAELHWFGSSTVDPDQEPTIAHVFHEMIEERKQRVAEITIEVDDRPRVEYFLKWCTQNGLSNWTDLHPRDIQRYANLGKGKWKESYIRSRMRVVRWANEFVERNYPDFHRSLPYQLPRGIDYGQMPDRRTLLPAEVVDFLSHIAKKPHGWEVLPGIALCGLVGCRLQEMRRLTWRDVDLDGGTLTIQRSKKGLYRVIPLPDLAWNLLSEAWERSSPGSEEPVVPAAEPGRFRQRFNRYLATWNKARVKRDLKSIKIEPNGLRRTLFQAALIHGFYGISLELYIGHKPPQIPAVTWKHYLDRLEFDPGGVGREMFGPGVVEPWNRQLGPLMKPRPILVDNVVKFPA